jgi:[ribosomal protein S18]-alanine N-acetyltransferase
MTVRLSERVDVRWMIRREYRAVIAIETASRPDPWTEDVLVERVRKRNCIGLVAETPGGLLLGFMVYDLWPDRLEIARLAVDPCHRRRGVGTALVLNLLRKLSAHRRNRLVADVPEWALAAQLMFRSAGVPASRVLRRAGGDVFRFDYRVPGCRADAPAAGEVPPAARPGAG